MFIYMTIASVDLPTPFLLLGALAGHTVHNSVLLCTVIKVTIQFERRFRLMEHISVISWRNPKNLYIIEKLNKFSKSLLNFYLVILNK